MAQTTRSSMTDPKSWLLQVTAGPQYDPSDHSEIIVNSEEPYRVSTDDLDIDVYVRVRDFRGIPKSAPKISPYFSHPSHLKDRYSISMSFRPKRPIQGNDLVWGNDFDHPVRDMLPPGFSYAFKFVKWWIDPGLDGDPYADEPYLYGPVLASMNSIWLGDKPGEFNEIPDEKTTKLEPKEGQEVAMSDETCAANNPDPDQHSPADSATDPASKEISGAFVPLEGASSSGSNIRDEQGIPSDAAARRKHFLDPNNLSSFVFEPHREYRCDFHNEYLDFSDFSLKLPGFSLNVIQHLGTRLKRDHQLRYVLKDKERDKELLVVVFNLIPAEGSEFANQDDSDVAAPDEGSGESENRSEDEGVD